MRRFLSICLLVVALSADLPAHGGLAGQIAALTRQLAADPDSAELLVRRADLYRAARQWTAARNDLERARALEPDLPAVDLMAARVGLDQGAFAHAAQAAGRVLARDPDHAEARLLRARAYGRLDRPDDAAADYTRALAGRPSPDLYIERARVMRRAPGASPAAALRGLEEGLARFGSLLTLELEALDLEVQLDRHDAALARIDRLRAHAVRQETWHARRGDVLAHAGRSHEACTAYEQALAAVASLPPSVQRTRATTTLVNRVHASLARLSQSPVAKPPHNP